MKKRILQANLDGTGGAFSLMYQLQKQLQDDFIFDYYWMGKFVHSKRSDELENLGSKIYQEDLRKNRLLGHILLPFYFYRFLKEHNYEIVHINADLAYKLLIYAFPAKKAGVKKIIIHSHSSNVNGNFKMLKKALHKICKPFLKRNANIFLTCSKLASDWMYSGNKIAPIMINNGVDLDKFKYDSTIRASVRRELNLESKKVIGMVGNLSYQKNPELLIDIAATLPKNNEYRLLFIGDGPSRKNIESYAKKKGVYDLCLFYGNSDKVERMLSAMDVYVMTSRFEGLPVSAIEAQASGLPCLLSDRITKEAKILPYCDMIPLNDIERWDKEIEQASSFDLDRTQATNTLKEKHFDIKDVAITLKEVYLK